MSDQLSPPLTVNNTNDALTSSASSEVTKNAEKDPESVAPSHDSADDDNDKLTTKKKTNPLFLLQSLARTGKLSASTAASTTLSSDGKTLTIIAKDDDAKEITHTFDATVRYGIGTGRGGGSDDDDDNDSNGDGKPVTYSLASVYLQIVDPDISLVQYRKACDSHNVQDPVKVLDKNGILKYFYGTRQQEQQQEEEEEGGQEREKEREQENRNEREDEEEGEEKEVEEEEMRKSDRIDKHKDTDRKAASSSYREGRISSSAAAADVEDDERDSDRRKERDRRGDRRDRDHRYYDRDRDRGRDGRSDRERDRERDRHRDRERDRERADKYHRSHHKDRRDRDYRDDDRDKRSRHHSDRYDNDKRDKKYRDRGRDRDRDRDYDDYNDRGDKRSGSGTGSKEKGHGSHKKKPLKAPITNEQLMQNLNIVVDKRTQPPPKKMLGEEEEGEEKEKEVGGEGAETKEVEMDEETTKEKDLTTTTEDATREEGATTEKKQEMEGTPNKTGETNQRITPSKVTPPPTPATTTTVQPPRQLTEEEERAYIRTCLSSKGFEVVDPSIIESDRLETSKIIALEIPVGNSESILRAGAGGERVSATSSIANPTTTGTATISGGTTQPVSVIKRDFTRVLDLYNEVINNEEKLKRMGGSSSSTGAIKRGATVSSSSAMHNRMDPNKRQRTGPSTTQQRQQQQQSKQQPPRGKPIIVVPNAMTSPISMINAKEFLNDAIFIPRDVQLKKGVRKVPSITISRRVTARHSGASGGSSSATGGGIGSNSTGGGGPGTLLEYEIIDNPITKLTSSHPAEWERIVAVVAQGASWQFKGWKYPYSNPVDIFSKAFGFYIGMEGAPTPKEITGWNVKKGLLNRDKRGLDRVTFANFWNGLDEWMAVHKPEYLPHDET